MLERDFKGVWISKEIWLNENLDITEKALFAEIDSLDNEKGCTASNKYFVDFFKISESTVTRAISHLKDLGLIESSFDGRIRTLRVVKLTTLPSQNDEHNNTNNIRDNSNTNIQQSIITDNTNINNKEDTYREKVQQFVADYNSICKSLPKCVRMTPNRSKAIVKLLKKYSYDEILEVFNKLEASTFCKGNNQNGWRATIDFILREDKFVNVLEGKYDNKGKRNNFEKISHGEKYTVSAEEKEEMRKAVERGELEEY